MPRRVMLLAVILTIVLLSTTTLASQGSPVSEDSTLASWPGGLVIDHTCIDLDIIPSEWIDSAQDNIRVHYAHTSHGGQITEGLSRIESENSTFDCSIGDQVLPTDAGTLCILDGNPPESYITPELYWQGASARAITQNTINNNPTLSVSLWSWCTQLYDYSEAQAQEYLGNMSLLESANPDITFIYMTCNAQSTSDSGYNRWLRNEQIRQYCQDNDKILFDFADLDCWSDGVHSTYDFVVGEETLKIPVEHPDFNGDEAAHTTYTSCEQKGKGFWWLMAMLAGWNAPDPTTTTTTTGASSTITNTGSLFAGDILLYTAVGGVILLLGYAIIRRYRG